MSLRVRGMPALHEIAAKRHRAEDQKPTSGPEVPRLHGDVVQKAAMLAMPHHVVTKNTVE